MKNLLLNLFLLVIIGSVFTSQISAQYELEELRGQIDAFNAKFSEAMTSGNTEATLDLYTDDAYSLPSYSPMIKGKEAIKAQAIKDKEAGLKFKTFTLTTVDVFMTCDI